MQLAFVMWGLLAAEPDVAVSKRIMLLHPPESMWAARVRVPELAEWEKAVMSALEKLVPAGLRTGLRVTLAVKPGRRARAWVEDVDGKLTGKPLEELERG